MQSKAQSPRRFRLFGRTVLTSAGATAFDWTVASVLVVVGMTAPLATLLGSFAGGVANWLANRLWAFRTQGRASTEALRYALVSLSAAWLNAGAVALLEPKLGFQPAWFVARAVVYVGFTFVLFHVFVFRTPAGHATDVDGASRSA